MNQPQAADERDRPLGRIHEGRTPDRNQPERRDARESDRLRRYGNWVFVTFRGFDDASQVRIPGWLNLNTVRSLVWDDAQQVTLIESVGQGADEDGRRVVERPETVLGAGG